MRTSKFDRRQLLGGASLAALASLGSAACQAAGSKRAVDLGGKSILITGCSSGFGRIGALYYARRGARVIASMRDMPRPEARELADQAAAEKLDLHIVEIDVLSQSGVETGVARAEAIAGGALDVFVNNAGIASALPVEMQDMAASELIFDTNVLGYQRMARAVLPAMRAARRGQIFNVSSQLGRVIVPGYGLYSATKFAVEAMSEQMAYELAPHGVDVTIIQPGGYQTAIWENANRNTAALLARRSAEERAAYSSFVDRAMQNGAGRDNDVNDVPRAIADIIAMPAGTRPLRKAVHPRFIPQAKINAVGAQTQLEYLGNSAYGPLARAVLD